VFAQRYQFGYSDVRLLKDIAPGADSSSASPRSFAQVGQQAFFVRASGPSNGLWVSDGTRDGTKLVKDFAGAGQFGYAPSAAMGNNYYFSLNDEASHRSELWKSDGTPQGTVLVREFAAPALTYETPNNIQDLTPVAGTLASTLYFTVDDGQYGRELWASDGTRAGTRRVTVVPSRI
jgi:ELWxxDGT repeat protein